MRLHKGKRDLSVLRYLAYFSQVGFTMITPPLLFAFGAIWLRKRFGLGNWIVVSGILLGIAVAFCGLRDFLQLTEREARKSEKKVDKL